MIFQDFIQIHNEVLESALFSLEKKRNIMIVGDFGTGKSHIAREITKIYNLKNNKQNFYHFICTEETKISDLIGYISPRKEKDLNEDEVIMEWKKGFLSKSIEKGTIVILDNLQEADSTITERLNGLLDIKYDEDKKKGTKRKFDIPENPDKSSIDIHKDFRIIGVCNSQNITNMSPAFLNRFDIIILENQLANFKEKELKELIKNILYRKEETEKQEKEKDEKEKEGEEIQKEYNINYIVEKFYNNKNNKHFTEDFSIKQISRFCYSLKLFLKIKEFEEIDQNNIIDFIFDLLFEEDIKIHNKIKDILLQKFIKKKNQFSKGQDQFIFEGNQTLENYIFKVYASFIINLNLCIIGSPGVGKTSSTQFISDILKGENHYKLFNFHRTTKPNHLYGTINLKEGKIEYYKGPLMEAAAKGYIFIADEMNLSSSSTMKSTLPLLDPQLKKNILIPGLDKSIDIKDDFFFISCQNDVDNFGRNYVPEIVQRELRIIKYPKQNEEEIVNICVQKCRKEFSNKDRKINKKKEIYDFSNCPNFNEDNSKKLGTFMVKYNEKVEIYKLPLLQWSFRDIDKIIKRIFEHINDTNNYINFKFYHFIYFYLFSSISKENLEKMINFCEQKQNKKDSLKNIVHKLFIEIFELDSNISEELKSSFFGKPKIDINKQLIIKENLQIKFDFGDELKNSCNSFNLSNYYNDLFKLKLFSNYEPVLLIGPSSYKTHLAEYYIKHIKKANYNKIYLNQKTTIEDLLGGPYFLSQNLSKYYYFYLLWKIIDIPYEKEHKKKLILNFFGNIINQNHKIKILCKIYNNIYNNFQKSLQRKNNKPQIVFKEGEILLSILKKESIIFKDIHKVPTEVFERFNEFLSSERILSLNEDIYGTFFSDNDDNKIIDVKQMDNIEIIATCPENSFQALLNQFYQDFRLYL